MRIVAGRISPGLGLAALLIVASVIVQAAPILGTIKVGGEVEVTQTTIDFSPYLLGAPLDGTGRLVTLGAGLGIFAPLVFGDQGTIVDRAVTAGIVPAQPAGVPINVQNWLVFDSPAFHYALDLKYLSVGAYTSAECFLPAASGQSCTPPAPSPLQSPYNLTNFTDAFAGLSSNANFSVSGVMRNLDTNEEDYLFNGVFGAEFLGTPYQALEAAVAVPDGSVLASYSATLNATAIPEPSTVVLSSLGALGLMAFGWIRRRHSNK